MAKTIPVETEHDIQIVTNVCLTMLKKGKISVTIKKFTESLSDKQWGLYFLWIGILGPDMGYTKDEMHHAMKERFLLTIFIADTDNNDHDILRKGWENLHIVRREMPEIYDGLYATVLASVSIKSASVENMRDYLKEIDNLAHWQGVKLPRPEDKYYEAMGIKR